MNGFNELGRGGKLAFLVLMAPLCAIAFFLGASLAPISPVSAQEAPEVTAEVTEEVSPANLTMTATHTPAATNMPTATATPSPAMTEATEEATEEATAEATEQAEATVEATAEAEDFTLVVQIIGQVGSVDFDCSGLATEGGRNEVVVVNEDEEVVCTLENVSLDELRADLRRTNETVTRYVEVHIPNAEARLEAEMLVYQGVLDDIADAEEAQATAEATLGAIEADTENVITVLIPEAETALATAEANLGAIETETANIIATDIPAAETERDNAQAALTALEDEEARLNIQVHQTGELVDGLELSAVQNGTETFSPQLTGYDWLVFTEMGSQAQGLVVGMNAIEEGVLTSYCGTTFRLFWDSEAERVEIADLSVTGGARYTFASDRFLDGMNFFGSVNAPIQSIAILEGAQNVSLQTDARTFFFFEVESGPRCVSAGSDAGFLSAVTDPPYLDSPRIGASNRAAEIASRRDIRWQIPGWGRLS